MPSSSVCRTHCRFFIQRMYSTFLADSSALHLYLFFSIKWFYTLIHSWFGNTCLIIFLGLIGCNIIFEVCFRIRFRLTDIIRVLIGIIIFTKIRILLDNVLDPFFKYWIIYIKHFNICYFIFLRINRLKNLKKNKCNLKSNTNSEVGSLGPHTQNKKE